MGVGTVSARFKWEAKGEEGELVFRISTIPSDAAFVQSVPQE